MSDDWYYMEGAERRGPVSEDELVALLARLPADTQVWRTGAADWTRAQETAELQGKLPPPPPKPARGGNRGVVVVAGIALAVVMVPVLLFVIGIVAAIAIPSFLRARVSANESATIGDLRSVASAQAAYASANGGYFDSRLACLSAPGTCIPGYSGPTFLDAQVGAEVRSGYRRTLRLGSTFEGGTVPEGISPSSTETFAYVAVPERPNQTGVRGFCVDGSGVVCWVPSGSDADALVEERAETGRTSCSEACRANTR